MGGKLYTKPNEIRRLRDELGYTRKVLAEKVRVNAATIERWEYTGAAIHPNNAERLAITLGCAVEVIAEEREDEAV